MKRLPIKYVVFNNVYKPSDDTFLLIDALENIDVYNKKILEIGCGSGVISLYLAYKGGIVEAVDISEDAIKNTIYNAKLNNLSIKAYKSDLFSSVKGVYDIIIFNPPYLEDRNRDYVTSYGTEIILDFLDSVGLHLNPGGQTYFIINDKNDYGLMLVSAKKSKVSLSIILRKKLFFEELYVVRGIKYA